MSIQISDSELSIMKVLWKESPLPSSEIAKRMDGNVSILKTMLKRLLAKGAIGATPVDGRSYLYTPLVAQADYTAQSRRHFVDKVFDGSSQAMLMNFVMEEKVSVEDLQSLIDMLQDNQNKGD